MNHEKMGRGKRWDADFADASNEDKNGLKISVNPRCKSALSAC